MNSNLYHKWLNKLTNGREEIIHVSRSISNKLYRYSTLKEEAYNSYSLSVDSCIVISFHTVSKGGEGKTKLYSEESWLLQPCEQGNTNSH